MEHIGNARKTKFDGGWVWELPGQGDQEGDQIAPSLLSEHLQEM
jgi:hypothetical protein